MPTGAQDLRTFLVAIQSNPTVLGQALGASTSLIDDFIATLDELIANQKEREYILYKLKDKDYTSFEIVNGELRWKTVYGIVASNGRTPNVISRPHRVKIVDDEIWVVNQNTHIARFDKDFSYIGAVGVYSGDPSIGYTDAMSVHVSGNNVFIPTSRHQLFCLDKTTGEIKWVIGEQDVAGYPDDATPHLYRPYDCFVHPGTGELWVACYDGRVSGVPNYGYIARFSFDDMTATFQGYVLTGVEDGHAWNNAIDRPSAIQIQEVVDATTDYYLWVAYHTKEYVAKFKLEGTPPNTPVFQGVYGKDPTVSLGSAYVYDFVFDDTRIWISHRYRELIGQYNLNTRTLEGHFGEPIYEDFVPNSNTFGGFREVSGIAKVVDDLGNEFLVVCDRGNNRVHAVPISLMSNDIVSFEYEKLNSATLASIEYVSDNRIDLDRLDAASNYIKSTPRDAFTLGLPRYVIVAGKAG